MLRLHTKYIGSHIRDIRMLVFLKFVFLRDLRVCGSTRSRQRLKSKYWIHIMCTVNFWLKVKSIDHALVSNNNNIILVNASRSTR